jgi:hypothetical protein
VEQLVFFTLQLYDKSEFVPFVFMGMDRMQVQQLASFNGNPLSLPRDFIGHPYCKDPINTEKVREFGSPVF